MSKKFITLLLILILAAACLSACGDQQEAEPTPSSDPAIQENEEATTDNGLQADAEAMRDYLGQYIDLSLYNESAEVDYEYTLTLTANTAIESKVDAITPEVVLPDFKNLAYGMQFKEMADAGFSDMTSDAEVDPQVGVPASLTVSTSPFVTIDLMVFNPLTTTNSKYECVIDNIDVPVTDALTFEYNGITDKSTLEDVIETFGAPDLSVQIKASEFEHNNDMGDNLIFRMFYDNHDADQTQTELDFIYDKETGTTTFSRLSIYENDNY